MGSIPVANPAPMRKPHGMRPALLVSAALLIVSAAAVVVIAFTWPQDTAEPSYKWVSLGQLDDYRVNEPVAITKHHFWLVRLDSGEVLALSRRDPRLGCTVPWRPDFEFQGTMGWFRNPCHGQTYDVTGHCVFGPCARDLDRYPVAVVGGEVHVDVRSVLCADERHSGDPVMSENGSLFIYGCLPPHKYGGTPPTR